MKNKKLLYVLVVLGIIFVILGSTFAYWSWSSSNNQSTAVTFTVTSSLSCSADGGGNISNNALLAPSTCTNSNYAIQRPITVSTTSNNENSIINLDLYLNVDSIDQELLDTDYFMYALTESSSSCANPIEGGSFQDKISNDKVPLLTSEEFIGTETKTYYL
ncbi:MAG: hypothetical protein IKI04_03525, partial [Bacilli bacterium]|nr:hypothetical protein [Bacilli bacterium]